jgi:hypothetical protein
LAKALDMREVTAQSPSRFPAAKTVQPSGSRYSPSAIEHQLITGGLD